MEDKINNIAQKVLNIKTLESQKSDDLDFHNIAVWELKEAYKAGKRDKK